MTVSRLSLPPAVDCIDGYLVAKEYHIGLLQKHGSSGVLSRLAEMFVVSPYGLAAVVGSTIAR